MTDEFFMDVWQVWTIFTIILCAIWVIAVIIQFIGKTQLIDVTNGLYKGFLICSWVVVLAVMLGYSIPLRSSDLDLIKACNKTVFSKPEEEREEYAEKILKKFEYSPIVLVEWIRDRTYYAGQNTIIVFGVWQVISLFYILDIFCCIEKSNFG